MFRNRPFTDIFTVEFLAEQSLEEIAFILNCCWYDLTRLEARLTKEEPENKWNNRMRSKLRVTLKDINDERIRRRRT